MACEINHTCENCGDTSKQDKCYCNPCMEAIKEEVFEVGRKQGQQEAVREN